MVLVLYGFGSTELTLGAERLINQDHDRSWLHQIWLVDEAEFAEGRLLGLCQTLLRKEPSVPLVKVLYFAREADLDPVVQWHRSYTEWVSARNETLARRGSCAECFRIGNMEGWRARTADASVLEWGQPSVLLGSLSARLIHFGLSDRVLESGEREKQIDLFFSVNGEPNLSGVKELWSKLMAALPDMRLSVSIRRDPWFALISHFPIFAPFVSPPYPSEKDWQRQTLRCDNLVRRAEANCNTVLSKAR